MVTAPPPRVPILGVPVDMTDLPRAVARAAAWIEAGERTYTCHADARSILEARDSETVRSAFDGAGLVGADGMPVVWLGRARSHAVGRVYGPDFMQALIEHGIHSTPHPFRHFLFGSTPPVLERLHARLMQQHPGIIIVGTLSPPMGAWDEAVAAGHRAAIDAARPDIVWVSLGAPRQDLWMAGNRAHLQAPLLCGVGAAFDFLAGTKPQAPAWMRHHGLEWAFRLATEPRRLAGRYLRTVPRFAALALAEEIRRRLA
jgi:N-acetylglucosaminyldiphosphoundecaprenol N-acetyl-beta-D-mannosaminyltransferase